MQTSTTITKTHKAFGDWLKEAIEDNRIGIDNHIVERNTDWEWAHRYMLTGNRTIEWFGSDSPNYIKHANATDADEYFWHKDRIIQEEHDDVVSRDYNYGWTVSFRGEGSGDWKTTTNPFHTIRSWAHYCQNEAGCFGNLWDVSNSQGNLLMTDDFVSDFTDEAAEMVAELQHDLKLCGITSAVQPNHVEFLKTTFQRYNPDAVPSAKGVRAVVLKAYLESLTEALETDMEALAEAKEAWNYEDAHAHVAYDAWKHDEDATELLIERLAHDLEYL